MPIMTPLAAASLALSPLFCDHMVLQQGLQNPIWGSDVPGETVSIAIDGASTHEKVDAVADANGRWTARLPELPAGGPYTITVDGSDEDRISDVLVGEVWLVSGQSNMEFMVKQADGAEEEIAAARNPQIRHFKVAQNAQKDPVATVPGAWVVESPESLGDFSAAGYYFAKEINGSLGVPVGIINSTWGGTCVEAWTSLDVISRYLPDEEIHPTPASEERARVALEQYRLQSVAWRNEHMPRDPGNDGFAAGWANTGFDDSGWGRMHLPRYWQSDGLDFNGTIWFRRHIDIPLAWAGRELTLSLGAIDDYDTVYFNGVPVGATGRETLNSYQVKRTYTIPANLVKAGDCVISVRVFDDYGDGGFAGPASAMLVTAAGDAKNSVEIAGEWLYKVEHNVGKVPVTVFAGSPSPPPGATPQNRPAWLYNGMVNPLVPYGIRGVLWYQGEQNQDNWQTYGERVRAMIRDWRARWGEGNFPFYYVQLAAYGGTLADWAELRAQQDEALKEPNTGRALAIDIGNKTDIHPKNKSEVGRRLALQALANVYGRKVADTEGPVFAGAKIEGAKVRIHFTHADLLRTHGGGAVLAFEIAGEDGVFHPAVAVIENGEIVAEAPGVAEPKAVRYAWANAPDVNLENGEGLPCAPFRCLLAK